MAKSLENQLEIRIGDLVVRIQDSIDLTAQKVSISIQQYIEQQQQFGVSDEEILKNITDDLKTDRIGLFREFKNEVRDRIIGATRQAQSLGMAETLKQFENLQQFRWVAVYDKSSCEDCKERHGRIEELRAWEIIGLPASGFSVCNENCRCIIEPVEIPEHGAIDLSKE